MMNLSNHARALRCIGQALQNREIEVFELKTYAGGYRLTAGDPQPPYTDLIELVFNSQNIEVLDREGQALRGRASGEVRFDALSEMLRALGEYVDRRQLQLRRIDNSASPIVDEMPALTLEYQTRSGDIRTEDLPVSFLREASVRMYKHRANTADRIELLTRKR